ncbi:MAG TPA: CHAD domain-containing protein [Deltaproteobacteria bacterium]|nr:CHAD domain-containing protein [Deltaproteobacteria bacterium]
MATFPVDGADFKRQVFEGLAEQAEAIRDAVPGVRLAKDPEDIHRMRVASRRLRIRLRLFEDDLPKRKARFWRRRLRRLTRALGEARDADVQLAFLDAYLAGLPEGRERAGVERLRLRIRRQRSRLQTQVREALDEVEDSGILEAMRRSFQAAVDASSPTRDDQERSAPYDRAREAIEARVHEVLEFEWLIRDPRHSAELHRMRIAAKHLRYCMEAFAQLYGAGLIRPIKTAKTIQSMLGDIHDCDVWSVQLDQWLGRQGVRAQKDRVEGGGQRRLSPGIQGLIRDRKSFRNRRYRAFLAYWDRHAADWRDLLLELRTASWDASPHGEGNGVDG